MELSAWQRFGIARLDLVLRHPTRPRGRLARIRECIGSLPQVAYRFDLLRTRNDQMGAFANRINKDSNMGKGPDDGA
jgi:hypothetical protein